MSSTKQELPDTDQVKKTAVHQLKQFGESPVPPVVLAGLITSYQVSPFRTLPMIFPPVFLGTAYLNTQGYKTDAAGLSATFSALYLVLARRTTSITSVFKPRNWNASGLTKGATYTMCLAQAVGGGLAYGFGSRNEAAI